MIDVDHFKRFNDTAGHQAGDVCLRSVAHGIRSCCRAIDIVGRYGGEEFIVLVPETSHDGAVSLAQRMRGAVLALKIPHPGLSPDAGVTASFGVAVGPQNRWQEVLSKADAALYRAKSDGRDLVRAAPVVEAA